MTLEQDLENKLFLYIPFRLQLPTALIQPYPI